MTYISKLKPERSSERKNNMNDNKGSLYNKPTQIKHILSQMAEVLPDRVFVVAQSYSMGYDFCHIIGRQIKFISSLSGLERCEYGHVVMLGRYYEIGGIDELHRILNQLKGVTIHYVKDW